MQASESKTGQNNKIKKKFVKKTKVIFEIQSKTQPQVLNKLLLFNKGHQSLGVGTRRLSRKQKIPKKWT